MTVGVLSITGMACVRNSSKGGGRDACTLCGSPTAQRYPAQTSCPRQSWRTSNEKETCSDGRPEANIHWTGPCRCAWVDVQPDFSMYTTYICTSTDGARASLRPSHPSHPSSIPQAHSLTPWGLHSFPARLCIVLSSILYMIISPILLS